MFETMPVTPLSDALGQLMVEVRLLESRWPSEIDRRSLQRGLAEVHRDVVTMVVLLQGASPTEIGERVAAAAHEAFLAALVLAVHVQRIAKRSKRRTPSLPGVARVELPPIDGVANAAAHLLDLLDPYVQRADVALRRVMLDGEPMDRVTEQMALPA